MLIAFTDSLSLIRFGGGRGGGLFALVLILAIVGIAVWAFQRPSQPGTPKP